MNPSVALVFLIAVAGIVECKPKADLKARVLAKVAQYQTKRAEGDGEIDWPYGWMEYASLVGKCSSALNWFEFLEIDVPEEDDGCILSDACPKALELGEDLLDADDDEMEKATEFMRKIFGLLQCVNLQAEREELEYVLELNQKNASKDCFLNEAKPLFDKCEAVFDKVEQEEEQFEKELQQFKDSKRGTNIHSLLRELLKANRR